MEILHPRLHEAVLLRSRAVTGIIGRWASVQPVGKRRQSLVQRELGQVEAADEHVRLEPVHDVEYTPVGAAAEENPLPAFLSQQVLLMPKVLAL